MAIGSRLFVQESFHSAGQGVGVFDFALPNHQRLPATQRQSLQILDIPSFVSPELCKPEFLIGFRNKSRFAVV